MFKIKEAQREKVKLMIGLTGPSGSGKTYSALKLAQGITGDLSKVILADTENKSALYYAGDKTDGGGGVWKHIDFPYTIEGSYSPRNFIRLIEEAEKDPTCEVLILDSISHEWEGRGGCLELVDSIGKGFAGWKSVTPLHSSFIDKMRHSRLHIIATMRSKQDWVVEQNDKGKATPRKVGLRSTQREGVDYEFGLIFDIEMNHFATAAKDRTGLFSERGPFKITPTIGEELLSWANSGTEKEEVVEIYQGELEQKKYLAGLCQEAGLSKEIWATVHKASVGKPMSQIKAVVLENVSDVS